MKVQKDKKVKKKKEDAPSPTTDNERDAKEGEEEEEGEQGRVSPFEKIDVMIFFCFVSRFVVLFISRSVYLDYYL